MLGRCDQQSCRAWQQRDLPHQKPRTTKLTGPVCRDLQEVRLHEEVQRLVPDLDKPTDIRVQQHHSFPGKRCTLLASDSAFGVR